MLCCVVHSFIHSFIHNTLSVTFYVSHAAYMILLLAFLQGKRKEPTRSLFISNNNGVTYYSVVWILCPFFSWLPINYITSFSFFFFPGDTVGTQNQLTIRANKVPFLSVCKREIQFPGREGRITEVEIMYLEESKGKANLCYIGSTGRAGEFQHQ